MSQQFIIRGGKPLMGTITPRGSKNAASKMMVASLLTDEPCVIKNIPLIADFEITGELCRSIGSDIGIEEDTHTCRIHTEVIKTPIVPELSRKNRIPILAIGPLLHRKGVAEVPVLGGCPIGHRPINMHVDALTQMGIHIERREHSYYAEADTIRGADVHFPFPSVGATENVLLTATRARGTTRIHNAAIEPEILNLVSMLQGMGADIACDIEARCITIRGVERLSGTTATVLSDRNEVASFAIAALATKGNILIEGVDASSITALLEKITEAGGVFEASPEGVRIVGTAPLRGISLETSAHPGFMTDWQQPFCVLLTQAAGESSIHEIIYEDRFSYVKDLCTMGAHIETSDSCMDYTPCRYSGKGYTHSARIQGPTPLVGKPLMVDDLRAGMAHIIAALVAEGESVLSGIEHIDRGYEHIDGRLVQLGADIKRVDA